MEVLPDSLDSIVIWATGRPEVPLHNNISEGHVRDYVKKHKSAAARGVRWDVGRGTRLRV